MRTDALVGLAAVLLLVCLIMGAGLLNSERREVFCVNPDINKELSVGDYVYLKTPVKGYRGVEIVGFDGNLITVMTSSGWTFDVYEQDIED